MVLASTNTTATLEELAELADKVVEEVVAPTVAATSTSPCPEILAEIEQLRAEVQKLQTSVKQLAHQSRGRSLSRSRHHSPAPQEQLAGTTKGMAARQISAPHPATTPSRQTTRPAVSGDRRVWPQHVSPIARHRSHKQTQLPRRHRRTSQYNPAHPLQPSP